MKQEPDQKGNGVDRAADAGGKDAAAQNREVSRRDFLTASGKAVGALGFALALGGGGSLLPRDAGAAGTSPLSITVLGSGGPMAMSDRASPGYLVSIEGEPRILMDCGGGAYQRLGQGGFGNLMQVDLWLFSHFHIDHCSDFPAIIKSMYYLRRSYNSTALTIIGPRQGGAFPGASEYVDKNFNPSTGMFAYIHDFLKTVYSPDMNLATIDIPYDYTAIKAPLTVYSKNGVTVSSIPVMHGPNLETPSVAFRVDYNGRSITYSGDTNSDDGNMIPLAANSDVLIYDASLNPAQRFDPPDLYHTLPGEIGKVAQAAGVKKLVLSHFMPPYTNAKIQEIVGAVKQYYGGPVLVAEDLMTIEAA